MALSWENVELRGLGPLASCMPATPATYQPRPLWLLPGLIVPQSAREWHCVSFPGRDGRWRPLQGAEVLANACRLRRVGDQPDVPVRADEDQGVGAIRVCRVSVVVEEAAWPDKVGLDDAGFGVAEHWGAAFAEAEQGEVRPAEEIEEASWRAGGGVAQRRVRCPVARPGSGGPACGLAGEPAPQVSEHELREFGRGHGVHAAALFLDCAEDGAEPLRGDIEEPARNRQSFLFVRAEQAWRGVAGEHEAQLPAKVVGVLDPGVHAQATRDRVYVRGVSGEEHAAHL